MTTVDVDLKYIWHPAAQMKDYEKFRPLAIKRAQGVYLYTEDGREILDIIGSWWCSLLGHCNERINKAVTEQLSNLEHVIFANLTHEGAARLAQRLSKILPPGLCKFNFADNGSSAVEMALKIAFQYCAQTGRERKIKFACLEEGYHGETIGALSVGSMDKYTAVYKPMMMESIHIKAPDCYRCPFNCTRDNCKALCLSSAKESIEKHAHELCALIVEPLLQGAAGMRVYPEIYLKGLHKICKDNDVLFIADEIATGFGRTGEMFACCKADISPDIMTLSKGLTAGYMPMSIVCTTQQIFDAFYDDYQKGVAFMHSHTYAGNPLGCACANAVLDIFEDENILDEARDSAAFLTQVLNDRFGGHKNVGEIRHIGLIHALELVADKDSKAAFDPKTRTGYNIYRHALLEEGLLLRPIGDVLYFNPALNIKKEDLLKAVDKMSRSLDSVLGK